MTDIITTSPPPSWSISAQWIVPGDGRTIRHGVMRGRGPVIEAMGPAGEVAQAPCHRDLGNAAVLPGLVNAHTHLELTHLRGKLPRHAPMTRWLLALLRHRGSQEDMLNAVATGAAEALATGTTALVDICHNNTAWRVLDKTPLRKLCLAEVIGVGPTQNKAMRKLKASLEGIPETETVRPTLKAARLGESLSFRPEGQAWGCEGSERTTGVHTTPVAPSPAVPNPAVPNPGFLAFGITPHAPYSTSEAVYRRAVRLARQRGWPVCTHLAETKGERQFLLSGRGLFLRMGKMLGLLDDSFRGQGCVPMEFARRVGLLDSGHAPTILAHVNYIDDDELAMLAASGTHVVYCPRCSDFFGRSGHRYAEMLRAGINVALGTDSLASNTSLDMLAEMRRLRRDAQVDNATILRMATLNGAAAMGWAEHIGSLAPGKQADWIAVALPSPTADPLETILTTDAKVTETNIAGQRATSQ